MDPNKADAILEVAHKHFMDTYEDKRDVKVALLVFTKLLGMMVSSYICIEYNGVPCLETNILPTGSKKFPEVLRVLANVMELAIDIDEGKNNE